MECILPFLKNNSKKACFIELSFIISIDKANRTAYTQNKTNSKLIFKCLIFKFIKNSKWRDFI